MPASGLRALAGGRKSTRTTISIGVFASLAAGALLLLAVVSTQALVQSRDLQKQLDRSRALALLQSRVQDALVAAGVQGLQMAVNLALQERWGLREIAIREDNGRILASGSANRQAVPQLVLLPWFPRQTLQDGRLTARANGTEAVIEYRLGDSEQRLVHDEAVSQLQLFGMIGALVAVLFGVGLVVLVRTALRGSVILDLTNAESAAHFEQLRSAGRQSTAPAPGVSEELALTLDGVEQALILVDAELHVLQLNATAERLTGWKRDDATGQLIYTVFHSRDESGAPITSPAERCVKDALDIPPEELWLRPRGEAQPDRVLEVMACQRLLPDGSYGALMLFYDIRSRVLSREELKGKAKMVETVLDQLSEGVLTTDGNGIVRSANLRVQRIFGYSADELSRMTLARLLPVPFMNTPGIKLADFINPRGARLPKVAGWRKDATTFPAEISVKPIQIGNEVRYVVVVSDVTERQRSLSLTQRLGRLLDQASDEIYIFDAQTLYFQDVNAGARRNLGLSPEELARMTLSNIATDLDPATLEGYLVKLRGGDIDHLQYHARHRRADGSNYPVEVRLSFSRDEEPPVFIAMAQDITEREASEKRMRQLAHFDTLTGLPNRAQLFDRLKQAMSVALRTKQTLAVFFLDLNGFKPVNDNYGHEAGDDVLKQVAERLTSGLRAVDTVARLGGDEFVVLAQHLNDVADVTALAWKILELFDQPFEIRNRNVRLSTSLGITLYPQDNSEPEALLRHADAAMYQSKQTGPGRLHFYETVGEPATSRRSKTRRNLSREIQSSLAAGQFQAQFWPTFTSHDHTLAAAEADFHWTHPTFGRIESGETLYAARRSGLNVALEAWLLKEIIAQRRYAELQGIPLIPTVVNITGRQWRDPEFADQLYLDLREANAPAQGLILAISSEDWVDAAGAVQMLWLRLLEAGVRIGVREPDPKGPLESIGMILLGPATAERVLEDSKCVERVRAYTALGLPVLAEGVSTRQQRERLMVLGCSHISGPICGGPYTPTEFASWFGVRKVRPI